MPFSGLDRAAVAAALTQIADRPGDEVEAFFEILERTVWAPQEEQAPRLLRERGLAVRLRRGDWSWLASEDSLGAGAFSQAVRRVSRSGPPIAAPRLAWHEPADGPWQPLDDLAAFPGRVERAIRERHVAFPVRMRLERLRRWVQVVGPRLHAEAESEELFSCAVELPFGRFGSLLPELGAKQADSVAASLVRLFESRQRPAAGPFEGPLVLGPGAAAVLLHEAVAHALETDTLALMGDPERAVGLELGGAELSVLDDPAGAPAGVRRRSDDEGVPVLRRWLLRAGRVEQPLADGWAAARWGALAPGAARRSSRHLPPVPRSTFLELLPGEAALADLLAEAGGGLLVPEAERGSLEPVSGRFRLHFAAARRIAKGAPGEGLAGGIVNGQVGDLLSGIRAVGSEVEVCGAGWCAKGGQRLPVWASAPALLVDRVEVE